MQTYPDTCLVILSAHECGEDVIYALKSSACALDYDQDPLFLSLDEVELGESGACKLAELIHEIDPWSVVAIDEESIAVLRAAFKLESGDFCADKPANACGYNLVAVPEFADCLQDQNKKRIAWGRLKAAQHPGAAW